MRAAIVPIPILETARPCDTRRKGGCGRPFLCAASGFTLIEIVMVMALIGLLLSLAVPRYFATIDGGRIKVQQQDLATMRDALDKFFSDQGQYPETLDDLVKGRYLRSIPVDPLTSHPDWVTVAPTDPTLGGVYDIRSAADKTPVEAASDAAPVAK